MATIVPALLTMIVNRTLLDQYFDNDPEAQMARKLGITKKVWGWKRSVVASHRALSHPSMFLVSHAPACVLQVLQDMFAEYE